MVAKKSFITGLLAFSVASAANAALVLQIDPHVVAEYDGAFNFITANPNISVAHAPGHYYQVDFTMQITGLAAGQDFANMGINFVKTGAGLAAVDFGSGFYAPIGGSYDSNGAAPGGSLPHWQTQNSDPSGNDLLAILVAVPASEAGNRQYGETPRPAAGFADALGYPTLFGEVYYQWDGTSQASISATHGTGTYMQIYTGNAAGGGGTLLDQNDPANVTFASTAAVFLVPEPGSAALLGIGLVGLIARRRRA